MYQILPYTQRQAKKLGVQVKPSQRGNYKIDVFDSKGDYMFSGGDRRYSDYPHYLRARNKAFADERRRLYHVRHPNESMRGKIIAFLLW